MVNVKQLLMKLKSIKNSLKNNNMGLERFELPS